MTVSIVPTSTNGTRAEGGQTTGDPNGAIYEEGYEEENKVSLARFYFFNADGSAATGLTVGDADNEGAGVTTLANNYYDCEPTSDGGPDMPNVEKKLKSTILFKRSATTTLPAQMLVVINPEQVTNNNGNLLNGKTLSLKDLRTIITDFVPKGLSKKTGYFVMSNSVFASGENLEVENAATQLSETDYKPTPAIAHDNPINVYVERTMAKVRVSFDKKSNENTTAPEFVDGLTNIPAEAKGKVIKLKNNEGEYIVIDGKQIYLYVQGWNVIAHTKSAYLNKSIATNWEKGTTLFGTEPWNWKEYSRSFWALNPKDYGIENQQWITYNEIGNHSIDGKSNIYTNENAVQEKAQETSAASIIEKFTKVIIKGQLITGFDTDGKPVAVDVTEYLGAKGIGKTELKTQMLSMLQSNGMIYKVSKEGTNTKYTALSADDVDFVTAMSVDPTMNTETQNGRYYVWLQLTDDAANAKWSRSNAEEQPDGVPFEDAAEVNKYLRDNLGTAQLYGNADKPGNLGLTYYYFPIRHLGDAGKIGYYGVVRNHIYDCKITKLAGLGTPVYDPTETIYPEKPVGQDAIIAAKINIQSWRVVPNDQTLDW